LFLLPREKDGKIGDMGEWINSVWSWNLSWSGLLLARELLQVSELKFYIRTVTLQLSSRESICRMPEPSQQYSANGG
jgi:hypothetical protein